MAPLLARWPLPRPVRPGVWMGGRMDGWMVVQQWTVPGCIEGREVKDGAACAACPFWVCGA